MILKAAADKFLADMRCSCFGAKERANGAYRDTDGENFFWVFNKI